MSESQKIVEELKAQQEKLTHRLDAIEKAVDDVLWHQWLGDVCQISKHRITGPPPRAVTASIHN